MIWLFQQLWPLMLIALILGVVCTWLWMVRKVEAERATARTTSRVSTATTPVHADVAAKKTADSTSAPKEKNVPVAAAVGATAAGAAAATYAVGRFGQGSVDALPDGSQPHGYDIKGNADSMLYHTTDSPSYRQCKAEVWFRDEESAQAAGFRRWDAPKQPVAKSAESKATDAKVTESTATDAKATDAAVAASKTESDVAASVSAPRIVEGTADAGTAKFVDATAGGERSDALPTEDDTSRVHQAGAAAAAAGAAAGIAAGAAGARGPKPSVVEGKDNVDSHGVHEAPAGGVTYAVGRFGEGSVDPLPGGAMPVGYSIKGNADSMKYHTLESPSYSQCKAEVWFKDESSAQLAGFARWDAKAKADDVRKGIAEEPKTAGLQGEAEKPLTPVAPSAPTFSAADDASGQGERLAAATAGVTAGMYAAGAFGEGSVDPLPNGAQPVGYAIKGNAQSMLFHTEQSPSYGQCKAEVWFRDEATAEAAGFKHWDSSRRKAGAAAETAAAAPTYPEGRFGPGSVDPLPNNAQPEGYDIKGNAQSMLFHTPESPSYKVCIAEVWFADEESAKAAGFKHWDRRKRGL